MKCLDLDTLLDFLEQKLNVELQEEIQKHLDKCVKCRNLSVSLGTFYQFIEVCDDDLVNPPDEALEAALGIYKQQLEPALPFNCLLIAEKIINQIALKTEQIIDTISKETDAWLLGTVLLPKLQPTKLKSANNEEDIFSKVTYEIGDNLEVTLSLQTTSDELWDIIGRINILSNTFVNLAGTPVKLLKDDKIHYHTEVTEINEFFFSHIKPDKYSPHIG